MSDVVLVKSFLDKVENLTKELEETVKTEVLTGSLFFYLRTRFHLSLYDFTFISFFFTVVSTPL